MRNLPRRIERLEEAAGLGPEPLYIIATSVRQLALDTDRCLEILKQSGFLLPGSIVVVNLMDIPPRLSASELEQHLREHASEICR